MDSPGVSCWETPAPPAGAQSAFCWLSRWKSQNAMLPPAEVLPTGAHSPPSQSPSFQNSPTPPRDVLGIIMYGPSTRRFVASTLLSRPKFKSMVSEQTALNCFLVPRVTRKSQSSSCSNRNRGISPGSTSKHHKPTKKSRNVRSN